MFFAFPEDARWNAERQAVEFWVELGEYCGVVRVARRVFQRFLPNAPTPQRCVEAYLQRTGFESIAERKFRPPRLTVDGNVRDQRARLAGGARTRHSRARTEHQLSEEPPSHGSRAKKYQEFQWRNSPGRRTLLGGKRLQLRAALQRLI